MSSSLSYIGQTTLSLDIVNIPNILRWNFILLRWNRLFIGLKTILKSEFLNSWFILLASFRYCVFNRWFFTVQFPASIFSSSMHQDKRGLKCWITKKKHFTSKYRINKSAIAKDFWEMNFFEFNSVIFKSKLSFISKLKDLEAFYISKNHNSTVTCDGSLYSIVRV